MRLPPAYLGPRGCADYLICTGCFLVGDRQSLRGDSGDVLRPTWNGTVSVGHTKLAPFGLITAVSVRGRDQSSEASVCVALLLPLMQAAAARYLGESHIFRDTPTLLLATNALRRSTVRKLRAPAHQLACGWVHCRAPRFSRGLRQRLKQAADNGRWADAHGIRVEGHGDERPEPYSVELASSVFCVVLPGVVLSPSSPGDVIDIRTSLLPQQFAVLQHITYASCAHSLGSPCY